ncbi:MAG: hypothetical protein Q4G68_01610 [Planctomycetia bacterium]|nr:hypothetical protein [Planctomycetia bacterium]
MPTLKFTKATCRRIVESGSLSEYRNQQQIRQPVPGRSRYSKKLGHMVALIKEDFVQNGARDAIATCVVGAHNYTCHAPLARPGETLQRGLRVIIQWNSLQDVYEIINAERNE